MRVTAAIARLLKKEGVEYLFCYPSNSLIEACAVEGIRPILARTERTVISMADGYTRMHNGRKIGVCAVQRASGCENTFGGVAQAMSDSTPILILPGGNPRTESGVPYSFDARDHYRHTTKWIENVNMPERLPDMMRRAFSALRNGRRGPVMLEVPMDVGREEIDESAIDAYKSPKSHRSMADPDDVRTAAQALVDAERPVILVGQGVLYAEAWDELRQLAELLQAPVVATMNAKGAFPEDHPLSLGAAGATTTAASDTFLKRSDVILGAGAGFSANTYSHKLPLGKLMIQLTADERDMNRDYATDIGLIGDAKLTLRQLIDAVKERLGGQRRDGGEIAAEIASVRNEWLEQWMPRLTADDAPISPYRVIWEMVKTFDRPNTVITHDAGNPRDQILPFYEALTPRGYLGWGKSTHLGWGYGLAMGAKLAAPDKLAVNFLGDAAFGMVGMEVETAARERIGVLTVLLNNSGMGGYSKSHPTAMGQFGFSNLTGDYTKLASALGAYSERVEQPSDVAPALERASKVTMEGRPALLEMITRQEPELSRFPR
jgi:thiamine pyrophosphate-dependent acetolactate synthase large subunit-like protein